MEIHFRLLKYASINEVLVNLYIVIVFQQSLLVTSEFVSTSHLSIKYTFAV